MNPRTRTAVVSGVVVAGLLLLGAGFPTKGVPPKQWASDVCTAVTSWVNTATTGGADLKASLAGTNPDLRVVRDVLVTYMGDTADATKQAIDDMHAAGSPATPKGTKAAATLRDSFKKIRSSLRKLEHQAEHISIKRPAKARRQIKTLNRQVSEEFTAFQVALGRLPKLDPNHKLQRAFRADATCQAL